MPRLLNRLGWGFALASSKASSSSTPLRASLIPKTFSPVPSLVATSVRSLSILRPTTSPRLPPSLLGARPSILSTLARPAFVPLGASHQPLQIRCLNYGNNYQPSQRKRKRKHGFLVRAKGGRLGRATLARRRIRGRRFLSH